MKNQMLNSYVNTPSDLITSHESRRKGFLEYALRKSNESIPYIDKAKALKLILKEKTSKPRDILNVSEIRLSCYEAAGVSVKAMNYLTEGDLNEILEEFIKAFLEPASEHYVDELIYRYLMTLGDALGGRMRNIVGVMANEKLTRAIISQLQVLNFSFDYFHKGRDVWLNSDAYKTSHIPDIKSIRWTNTSGKNRQLIYNLTVPIVAKNIDIVVLNCHFEQLKGNEFKKIITAPNNYQLLGELKGGIDPAGADEHWKTANTALSRIRESFNKEDIDIPLIFIGAAIEKSMADEIFSQYSSGVISNCANLHKDEQFLSLCNWLVEN